MCRFVDIHMEHGGHEGACDTLLCTFETCMLTSRNNKDEKLIWCIASSQPCISLEHENQSVAFAAAQIHTRANLPCFHREIPDCLMPDYTVSMLTRSFCAMHAGTAGSEHHVRLASHRHRPLMHPWCYCIAAKCSNCTQRSCNSYAMHQSDCTSCSAVQNHTEALMS